MQERKTILEEFDIRKSEYQKAGGKMSELLEKALKKTTLKFLPISERIKERKSLEKKIQDKKYKALSDLTDIYGIRVIVFQNSDVDKVEKIIKNIFNFDTVNSVDKRIKESNDFGYNSMHSIVSLNVNDRLNLFSDVKIEIQVRTVLQHAWAEFSHELGYKNKDSVPSEFLSDINRISALLEVGDNEFERLRNERSRYKRRINKELLEGGVIEINQSSLKVFLDNNEYLKEVTNILRKDFNIRLVESNSNYGEIIARLKILNINDVNSLNRFLKEHHNHFINFVKVFFQLRFQNEKIGALASNSPLFYLCHFIASTKGREFFLNTYHTFDRFSIVTRINLFDVYLESK